MTYSLRPSIPADAGFVTELEEICMGDYARAIWPDWTPSVPRFGFDTVRHRIVRMGGRDIGCVDLWNKGDHLLLDKLYLLPEHRGAGIGAAVLATIISEARENGLPLRLTVLASNPRARKFYEREGFVAIEHSLERDVMVPA